MKGTVFARGMEWDVGTLQWVKAVNPGGVAGALTNAQLRASAVTVNGNVQIQDANQIFLEGSTADPSGAENGLIVRPIPSGTQNVNINGVIGSGGAVPTTNYATWTLNARPGAATQATATKAASGVGASHVVTGFTFSLAVIGTAQAAALQVDIIDGASGGGTRLWSGVLGGGVVNSNQQISVMGCHLKGSPNTALTIEFSGAGAAATVQACSAQGFDI